MADKIFTEGMIIKAPHQNAPSFVKLKLSFKAEDFRKFLNDNAKNGWVNVDVKESKDGKLYGELDTYERAKDVTEIKQEITKKLAPVEDDGLMDYPEDEINPEDVPF